MQRNMYVPEEEKEEVVQEEKEVQPEVMPMQNSNWN
jgi:hypothetical protein